jgi:hypothetical protein
MHIGSKTTVQGLAYRAAFAKALRADAAGRRCTVMGSYSKVIFSRQSMVSIETAPRVGIRTTTRPISDSWAFLTEIGAYAWAALFER